MVSEEQRKAIETAVRTIFSGDDYSSLYINLVRLMRDYSALIAGHDPKYVEIGQEETTSDLCTIEILMRNIEPLIIDDLLKGKD